MMDWYQVAQHLADGLAWGFGFFFGLLVPLGIFGLQAWFEYLTCKGQQDQ